MKDGCNAFIGNWDSQLEKVLINRKDDESSIKTLCYDETEVSYKNILF